jgi:hypothetical protein
VPLELRWERLEGWERRVRDEGEILLAADQLALVRVGGMEVVRVGDPNFTDWGGWRYGTRLPLGAPRPNLLERALGSLPPAPIEGYDPYGLTGPLGGGGGKARTYAVVGVPVPIPCAAPDRWIRLRPVRQGVPRV